ncbi:MAG: class I SAM-dependent methyltransferase [Chloroherpetonaceae bacterium]|nr:class I SAM-dependent methyltransferase [Chloroherpetonaceae bacterium]MDW8436507.1 class I SAM-dependent methyltransferase [Chloroherpetonaceae bacterium]
MSSDTLEKRAAADYERPANVDYNNVTYQRCQFAYDHFATPYVAGKKVLDVGCGHGYGTAEMAKRAADITGIDYSEPIVEANNLRYANAFPNLRFVQNEVPPINFPDESFDVVTSFQFIEHLEERREFIKEAHRVLRRGGVLLLSTPNVKRSLARNPFHVHEYDFDEMKSEIASAFKEFELFGLAGNEKVEEYYRKNAEWARRILKWDVFGLHKLLPASLLVKPYNFITNLMRKDLSKSVAATTQITSDDFYLRKTDLDATLDIFVVAKKI